MKLPMQKINGGLYPDGTEAIIQFEKVPPNKRLMNDITQPRNQRFHRLFWSLAARIGRGIGKDPDWVVDAFKVETKNYQIFDYGGRIYLVLGSIAFHSMDEQKFSAFFNECCDIMYRVWKIDPASVADLLVKNEDQKRG